MLLSKQPEELFNLLDRINLSVYSSAPVSDANIKIIEDRCKRNNVRLEISMGCFFNKGITGIKNNNVKLVNQIFKTCSLAWKQRCYTLYDGALYRCSRMPFIEYKLRKIYDIKDDDFIGSKLEVTSGGGFIREIKRYFSSNEPYPHCSYCFGSVGKKVKHRQLEKEEIIADSWKDESIKGQIDYIKLYRRLIKLKLFKKF